MSSYGYCHYNVPLQSAFQNHNQGRHKKGKKGREIQQKELGSRPGSGFGLLIFGKVTVSEPWVSYLKH